jgi:TolB-like protein/DNA-binding winged helix-turn-helix (wHTH) protein/Tfp pilus assembly protein PilF
MLTKPETPFVFVFGPFRLEPLERTLLRNGERVALTPKAFETLVALVERSNSVVEKDQLLKRVWRDTFVEETTLAQNIFTLRKTLGDVSNGSRYIETVPKVGYRFVASVQRLAPNAADHSPSKGVWWIAALLGVLISVAGFVVWRHYRSTTAQRVMLAVLPFENLSGDPTQDYLSDGLTEEMIIRLGQLRPNRLGVIARTTAMTYRGTNKSAAEIGRELGVNFLLEGSVRRSGDRVRISAQLISLPDQTHVWAESYERDVRDALKLESEVAGEIASQIEVKLPKQIREQLAEAHSIDPEAYEDYLRGRYFWNQRTLEADVKARVYFQRAIQRDPSDARSYAGLAETYSGDTWAEMQRTAEPAVARALQLDDSVADAHTSSAILKMYGYDWTGSEKEFRRAIELDPNSVPARLFHAELLQATGKNDEAVAEVKRAVEIDPLSVIANQAYGSTLYYSRRYDESARALGKTIELDPSFVWAGLRLARVYEQMGRYSDAEAEFQRVETGARSVANLRQAHLYAVWGKRDEALRRLARWDKRQDSLLNYDAAEVQVALGDSDAAFAALEQAALDHNVNLIYVKVDPELDPIRNDPRFDALLKRLGLY